MHLVHGIPDLLLLDAEDLLRIITDSHVAPSLILQVCDDRLRVFRADHGIHIRVGKELRLQHSYSGHRIGIFPI